MLFHDRREAGRALGERLAKWRGRADVVVLGIPRGGVLVAAEVARALQAPLDVFITHKIGAPDNPELAIGAVAGDGLTYLDDGLVLELGVRPEYIERERLAQMREIERRLALYRQGRPAERIDGRVAILCDDGIATGSTALVALRALRAHHPARVVLAIPVGPRITLERLARECDETVVLAMPEPFLAVGRFYEHFGQTSDAQVVEALRAASAASSARGSTHGAPEL